MRLPATQLTVDSCVVLQVDVSVDELVAKIPSVLRERAYDAANSACQYKCSHELPQWICDNVRPARHPTTVTVHPPLRSLCALHRVSHAAVFTLCYVCTL